MDTQLVKDLDQDLSHHDEKVPKYDPLAYALISDEDGHPAYLLVGVLGHVGNPSHEHLVILLFRSTQAGLDVV